MNGHLEGEHPYLGDLLTIVINQLLPGMILQVGSQLLQNGIWQEHYPPGNDHISPLKVAGKMFLFHGWDVLVPRTVFLQIEFLFWLDE